jgi:hypothetical protein
MMHRAERGTKQQYIRENRPDGPRCELLFLAGAPMHADDFERPFPYGFGLLAVRFAGGQPDKRHLPSFPRPFARTENGVLPDRSKIWWQPIANVNQALVHFSVRSTEFGRLLKNLSIVIPGRGRRRQPKNPDVRFDRVFWIPDPALLAVPD